MKKIILLSCILILLPLSVFAATINVPSEQPTIQAGIDAAENGDIVLLANGAYSGAGNYNVDFNGKSITVKSSGGAENCIIDCQQLGRGFLAYSEEIVILQGLTIKNGDAFDSDGGGVYAYGSDKITIIECIFENNSASGSMSRGGAVFSYFNSLSTFTRCTFINNSSSFGGAVYTAVGGSLFYYKPHGKFMECSFINNSASNSGGAVNCYGHHNFINCLFAYNTSSYMGGAVRLSGKSSYDSYLTNCSFTLNESVRMGGAIASDISFPEAPLILKNCILWGNTAPKGSEVYAKEKPCVITYSNIQGSHAGEGNIDTDPLFIDAVNVDLHLQYGSPCIDTGASDGASEDDLDGYLRPIGTGYDMGAYEYHYDTLFWQGYSSSWNDNLNWQPGMVPVEFNAVVISQLPSERDWPVVSDFNSVAEKVLIESGTLIIEQGNLTIGGS